MSLHLNIWQWGTDSNILRKASSVFDEDRAVTWNRVWLPYNTYNILIQYTAYSTVVTKLKHRLYIQFTKDISPNGAHNRHHICCSHGQDMKCPPWVFSWKLFMRESHWMIFYSIVGFVCRDTSGQGRFCTIFRSYSRGAQVRGPFLTLLLIGMNVLW